VTHGEKPVSTKAFLATALAALGVVYGDIGTSPLYALQESFLGPHAVPATRENVLGVLSLFVWSLVLVVCVKYLTVVMRADNNGEGGILALMALTGVEPEHGRKVLPATVILGIAGAALLYGDGVITPAISVLSAVEGLKVATPVFVPYIVPITVVILAALFLVQPFGSGRVGVAFGPVLLVWFACLGALGLYGIAGNPGVLAALSPHHAIAFFVAHGWHGFGVLGAVILCVTGGEALYADMGHFGVKPIRAMWYALVLPSLVLCYLGQGAFLLAHPGRVAQVFFNTAPAWGRIPLVVVATLATVVASQALITAVFSLTHQAIQLGYCPRMRVRHTSAETIGQIYLPAVNWALMVGCVLVVLEFRSSSRLAAAYGLAVAGTMLITTLLFALVARHLWRWSLPAVAAVAGLFLVVDLAFLGANLLKVADGGWLPLLLGGGVFLALTTWKRGKLLAAEAAGKDVVSLDEVHRRLVSGRVPRVPGTAVFLAKRPDGAPATLLNHIKFNQALHERVVLLTMRTRPVPRVPERERFVAEPSEAGFSRVVASYGFLEYPDVEELLRVARGRGAELDLEKMTFYIGRERIHATDKPGMSLWREKLFGFMQKLENPASNSFGLPPERVVELGVQLEI
jgi:KUP system potassium uptake protein